MRIKWFQRLLIMALLSSMALSWPLWFWEHSFPKIELFTQFDAPFWLDLSIVFLLCLSAVLLLFIYSSSALYLLFSITLFMAVSMDLNRLQVWSSTFFFFMIAMSIFPRIQRHQMKSEQLLVALQVLLLGAYFWIGINKMNENFFSTVLPYVTAPLQHQFTSFIYLEEISYPIPFLQVLIIPLLLWRKTRKLSVLLMALFHLGVIFLVGIFSYNDNSVIIPLNLFFIATLFLLFFKKQDVVWSELKFRRRPINLSMIGILILPTLSWFGPYPHNLSLDIYSGRYSFDPIPIEHSSLKNIPKHLMPYSYKYGSETYFDVYTWSMDEMNVPPIYEDYLIDDYKTEILKQCDSIDNSSE